MTCLARPAFGVLCLSAMAWAFGGPGVAYGGHGDNGSSGGSYGSHGSSGGSHGSSGGSHGSSGGSYGSHGSSGGSYGSHGSSGGSYGSSGGYVAPAAPAVQARRSYYRPRTSVARLDVSVPEKAKVYLQDQPMSLTGSLRRFVSPRLRRDTTYAYQIRVEVERDGKLISKTTRAMVRGGERVAVAVQFADGNPDQLVAEIQNGSRR